MHQAGAHSQTSTSSPPLIPMRSEHLEILECGRSAHRDHCHRPVHAWQNARQRLVACLNDLALKLRRSHTSLAHSNIWPATTSSSASRASQISRRVVHFQASESLAVTGPHSSGYGARYVADMASTSNHYRSRPIVNSRLNQRAFTRTT